MTYLHTNKAISPRVRLEAIHAAFMYLFARRNKTETGAEPGSRQTDPRVLRELARLSDEQLDDIGVRRKIRSVKSDYLARNLKPERTVTFDYFRV